MLGSGSDNSRGNTWYMDAWCHKADALRRFALDAIEEAGLGKTRAKDVATKQVQSDMDGGYGIYAGDEPNWVTLVFDARVAPWVSREEWHPHQAGQWLESGEFQLRVPYSDPRELAMDILRHAGAVRIVDDTGSVARVVRTRTEHAFNALASESAI